MFEELFSRHKQSKTKVRSLPKEIDAIQKVKGGGKRTRHSSMTVNHYLWLNRIVVGCIVIAAVGIIAFEAYNLIGDFVNYSSGEPLESASQITGGSKD